jgi:hypothetical protein
MDAKSAVRFADADANQQESRFGFAHSGDDKALVDILNAVDTTLPEIFHRLRTSPATSASNRELSVIQEVLEVLQGSGSNEIREKYGSFDTGILNHPEV